MKTSDKLLLTFSIGSLLVLGGMHFVLYAEYRQGHILTEKDLHEEKFAKYKMKQPGTLILTGTVWVNIIPSDSFYIELPKEGVPQKEFDGFPNERSYNAATKEFHLSGDTLYINGNSRTTLHRPFSDLPYRSGIPEINICYNRLKEIRLEDGQVILRGTAGPSPLKTGRLVIKNSTLWIGEQISEPGAPKEFFDTLDVLSENSLILLNTPSVIDKLGIRLDDHSELIDQVTSFGSCTIDYSKDSRINLSGKNFEKVHATIH